MSQSYSRRAQAAYQQGQLDACDLLGFDTAKLAARTFPPIRTHVRSENEPLVQPTPWRPPETENPFDELDQTDPRRRQRRPAQKMAAVGGVLNPMRAFNGVKPVGGRLFPTGGTQFIQAPKPSIARGATGAAGTASTQRAPLLPKGAVDPRANKPAGMNLQHQILSDAHATDITQSMNSPQRRFFSAL
jgi:hypothetical protein